MPIRKSIKSKKTIFQGKIREYEIFKESFREINNVLIAFAGGNFTKRGKISNQLHSTDAVMNGINMLGEELESSTVTKNYFLSIFNAVPDLVFVLNSNGVITNFNRSAERVFQILSEKEIIKFSEVINQGKYSFTDIKSHLKENEIYEMEATFHHHQKEFPAWCIFSTIRDQNKKSSDIIVVARDISYQKETEKKILRAIVETQEKEQQRVAEDLHDSLGQELAAIKLFMNSINSTASPGKKLDIINQCNDLIDDSIENLRHICFNLMPGAIELSDLNHSVESLLNKLKDQHSITFHFTKMKKKPKIPKNIELAVYRIIQEFISNSIKYAEAKNIHIELNFNKNIYLYLSDDGKGFNISKKEHINGNGLRNMNSRANAFNGKFMIESELGKGTNASVIIPINE